MTLGHGLRLLGRGIRSAWLVVGVLLGLLLALEGAYRLQGALRGTARLLRPGPVTTGPYAGSTWYPEIARIRLDIPKRLRWQPYVEVRQGSYRSTWFNIEEDGHRRTVQPPPGAATPRQVFLFGGSTMIGSLLRDSMTIPARLAAELAAAGVHDVAITNFGESGWVFTQDVLALMLQLRAGVRPAAVVFLDGGNDVLSAVQQGRAGIPLIEGDRERDFTLGSTVFSWHSDWATDAAATRALGAVALGRLAIVRRLRPASAPPPEVPTDSLVEDAVRAYLGAMQWVEALARRYGFAALYAWEPVVHPAAKPLSPYERQLVRSIGATAEGRALLEVRRLVPGRLAPRADALAPGRFLDLSGLFAGDSATAFVDEGHTTEAASAVVADVLARRVEELLRAPTGVAEREPGRSARGCT